MDRSVAVRRPTRPDEDRSRSLAEVSALAWLLDNSIPVPGTGGRRFGIDAIIGLVPGIGDVVSGTIGLLLIWRGSRMGLPRVVVARMLLNTLLDLVIGAIPVLGDAFDLWFKANTRNLGLMRRHLEEPERSTGTEWASILVLLAAVVGVVFALGWLMVAAMSALIGAIS